MIESRRDNGFYFQLNHRRKLALIPALMILSGVSWTGMCYGDKRHIKIDKKSILSCVAYR